MKEKNVSEEIIYENDFSGEINDITCKIMNDKFNINNILSNSYSDYNIISLNILDNIPVFFTKKKFLNSYLDIYRNICFGDKMNSEMIIEHNYELLDYILLYTILCPIFTIKEKYTKQINSLTYNKYISKSIYYISNYNIVIVLN